MNTQTDVVLAVRVVDAAGLPVVGVDVTFESSQAGDDFVPGSAVNPVTRTTDANGIVKVPMLVDGTPGIRTVTITATNLTAATIDVDVP